MNDIDLNGSEENPWTPIGNIIDEEDLDSFGYTGTFDGNGHTISGLYINSSDKYQGLFGYVSGSGKVQNLSVSGSVKGKWYVGGVVGFNFSGTVTNCAFSGSVSGSEYVGGVVGDNGGTVENCYNTGSVTSSGSPVGGVVGYNDSGGSVTNCYNTGTVTGTDDYVGGVGGVVGWNISSGNVTNCYNTGAVSGGKYVGGVVGYNSGPVTGCYFLKQNGMNESLQGIGDGSGAAGAAVVNDLNELCKALEYDTDTWTTSPFYNHPVLQENPEGGLGTATHPYEIKTIDQLKTFRDLVNGANDQAANPNAHAKLMNNIDLNPGITFNADGTYYSPAGVAPQEWTPIGTNSNKYTGTFDGNGHTISGLYIDSSADFQGLFGCLDQGGTVQDLTVSGSVSGINFVGGVVGYNGGNVINCTFSGSVSGVSTVGGVVGQNSGNVENCYNTGSVTGSAGLVGGVVGSNSFSATVTNCYNTGAVSGGEEVGGVVGDNYLGASVENCYNTGTVTGFDSGSDDNYVGGVVGYNISSTVKNCYNAGAVNSSGNRVGGVVGDNDEGRVENCYNTGEVSGNSYVGGVVGNNNSGNVANCYYQQHNSAIFGIGRTIKDDISQTAAKSLKDFHSGEVAWRLQNGQTAGEEDPIPQVWGQSNLNTDKSWPTLVALDKNENAKPVYKVAFISDNTEIEAQYANNGMSVTPPEAPNKTDHLFGGWFNNGELTGDPVTGPISVTGNATYTAKWTPFSYTLSATPDTLNFGSITEGEERPAAQTVTVKNTGNQTVTLNPPAAENFEIGALSKTELAPNATATFTIQPKENLPRGSYSEQITITGDNNVSETLTASFTVKEPPYTGKYSYELSTSVGDHGTISVDRYATEGDKVTIDVTPDQAYKLDDLTVTAHGKDVELTANSDGTYTFTMPSADVRITATFAEDPDWTEPEEPATDVSDLFIDIAPDAWYKDAIQYAYDNGLMTGVSATEFAPEATTTRAMIVSILARLEGVTTAEAAGFADVDDNDWYATAVNWAANVGVVNGYEDNTFRPNTAITREQLAAILMNYAAYKGEDVSNRADLTSYTDQPSTWAEEAISWSVAEGLLTGVTADTLQPQGAATRAQVAAILERFLAQ